MARRYYPSMVGLPALTKVNIVNTNGFGYPGLRDDLRKRFIRVKHLTDVIPKYHTIPADLLAQFNAGLQAATQAADTPQETNDGAQLADAIVTWHNDYRCGPNDSYPPLDIMVRFVFDTKLLGCTGAHEPIPWVRPTTTDDKGKSLLKPESQVTWTPTAVTNALVIVYETLFIFNQSIFGFTTRPGHRSFAGMAASYAGEEELIYKDTMANMTVHLAKFAQLHYDDTIANYATGLRNRNHVQRTLMASLRQQASGPLYARRLETLFKLDPVYVNYECATAREMYTTGVSTVLLARSGQTEEDAYKAHINAAPKSTNWLYTALRPSRHCHIGIGNDEIRLASARARWQHATARH